MRNLTRKQINKSVYEPLANKYLLNTVYSNALTQNFWLFSFRCKLWADVSSGAQYCGVSVLVLRHLLPDILQLSLPTNGRQPRCRNSSTSFVILCHIHFLHQNYLPISHAVTLLLPHFSYSKPTWLIKTNKAESFRTRVSYIRIWAHSC